MLPLNGGNDDDDALLNVVHSYMIKDRFEIDEEGDEIRKS